MVPPPAAASMSRSQRLLALARCPLMPLAVALLLRLLAGAWASLLCAALGLYSLSRLVRWWAALEVSLNRIQVKACMDGRPPAPSLAPPLPQSAETRSGQCARAGAASEAAPQPPDPPPPPPPKEPQRHAEWAPFSPSMPRGFQETKTCWWECDATCFDVRNIRYKTTKEKVPSAPAIYDCVGMDIIRDSKKIDSLMSRLDRPLPESPSDFPPWDASWGIPRVLCVNAQLPYQSGYMFGGHPEDDGGFSVVNYFVLSRQSCELLAKGQGTPAMMLWRRLVEEGVSSKEGISFKAVGRIEDLEGYEIPKSFHGFNNKPALVTNSAKVVQSLLPEVVEVDFDVRQWVYLARSTLARYHQRAKDVEFNAAYLVEGKSDDELPEQVLGCMTIWSMDILSARWVSVM